MFVCSIHKLLRKRNCALDFIDSANFMLVHLSFVCLNRYVSQTFVLIGMKHTNLRFIEEHRVYSLSKKGTATMLFLLHYDQTVDSKLKEMPLDALIERFAFPLCLLCTIARCRPSQISTVYTAYLRLMSAMVTLLKLFPPVSRYFVSGVYDVMLAVCPS